MRILNLIFSLFLPSNPEICFDYEYYEEGFHSRVSGNVCTEVEDDDIIGALYQCKEDLQHFYWNPDYLIVTDCYAN